MGSVTKGVAGAVEKVSNAVESLDSKDKQELKDHIHAVTPEGAKEKA